MGIGSREKTNKAQTIKGNQAGTIHVWFPCSISVRGDSNRCILGERRWYYTENEMPGEMVQETGL